MIWLAVSADNSAAQGTELCGVDPTNGAKICIISGDNSASLVSVSWSGAVVNGMADGPGNLTCVYKIPDKETKVQGSAEMKAGKLNGKANLKWSNGYSYDGYFQDGLRNGQGVFRWPDGIVYDGEWKNGTYDGYGVMKFAMRLPQSLTLTNWSPMTIVSG
ncbi:MORN repeat-containing protein [Thermodesulfobium narugense DSM 14796]|uniref:MORN repeat-containing protein n=1 Tax=Thermodesulfobium narugense DSM 14796 TaxID=747365 RepID=M1E9C7_9BACT|nr:MORN repeat-containing protein [Thermodesulfobium narugense]AEE15074.1 MORN repeat-containing protein [Thermodesulfobium narugense DSM 14796]